MNRSTIRIVAIAILALFGAPVAMHVVMHDLHSHHGLGAMAFERRSGHHDHEHPIVSSAVPQMPSMAGVAQTIPVPPAAASMTWASTARAERNVVAFGALRTDTDVGLQTLLSTFLI